MRALTLALTFALTFVLTLVLACPALAQKPNPKVQFRDLVKKAESDPERLLEAIRFAQANKLEGEANKLLKKLLKQHPDHVGLNEAAGRVRHEGKWMDAKKADKLVTAALRAKYKSKGLVEVKGIWVDKEHVEDAKQGIYHHGGDRVNRWEKQRLLQGRVRHPATGRLIAAEDLEKAKKNLFRLADGEWGDEAKADEYHSKPRHPWIVRSTHFTVVSTLPLKTIRYKVLNQVDMAYSRLMPVFGGRHPHPTRRPVVQVMAKRGQYQDFGERFGGGGSTHGAFLTQNMVMKLDGRQGPVGVAMWDKSWGPYYVRHAAALALCHAYLGREFDQVPEWFQRALGGYVERHSQSSDAKFFGKQHNSKGGVKDFAKWLENYEISADLPERGFGDLGYNIYQAGLVLSFCMRGGDKESTDRLKAITDAVAAGKKAGKAIAKLGKTLRGKEAEMQAYFAKIIR